MRTTIKQINKKIANCNLDKSSPEYVDWFFENCVGWCDELMGQMLYPNDNDEYVGQLELDENTGRIIMQAYDYDEVMDYSRKWNGVKNKFSVWEEWVANNPYPAPKFTFEVPETRGFSDTSERRDTEWRSLDLQCAFDEKLSELLGKNKLHPWMLRQSMQMCGMIQDFNMEESEVEDLIALATA